MTTVKKTFAIIMASCTALLFLLVSVPYACIAIGRWKLERQARERTRQRMEYFESSVRKGGSGDCYNLIILDESGSMSGLEEATLAGANETIAAMKAAADSIPDMEQFLSVVTFTTRYDGDTLKVLSDMVPVSLVGHLDTTDYQPSGGTPLYDAVGDMLMRMVSVIPEDAATLVTIITDGKENASVRYTSEEIKCMIDILEERGWTFAYIGANQDAILEAGRIGVSNALNYDANNIGIRDMMHHERSSRIRYYRRLNSSNSSRKDRRDAGANYFKAQ